jgi:Fe2+ or Zn2+ uptake regulation protein
LKRKTIQKTAVWDTIQSLNTHPSAESVFQEIQNRNRKISRATVFRLLNGFSDEGQLLRLRMPYGPDCYDHRIEKHSHIQCTKCGAVADVFADGLTNLDKPANLCGYKLTGMSIVYEGLCPQCQ